MDTKDALDHIKLAMDRDADFAFVWYANICMMIKDAGAEYNIAEDAADRIMRLCFAIDMCKVRDALATDKLIGETRKTV